MQSSRAPLVRLASGLALGMLFFSWSLFLSATAGIGLSDEAWFVRVGQRMVEGDTLYRDVSYGATPLAAWVTQAAFALFGIDVLVLKVLVALCFAASSVVCLRAAEHLGASRTALLLLALSLALFFTPTLQSLYSPLAEALFLLTFALLLSRPELSDARAVAVGIAAGLCFATKQNFGLLALAATLGSRYPRRHAAGERRAVALVVAAFALTVAIALMPLLWQHATTEFLDYAFLNKGSYARVGAIAYSHGLAELVKLLTRCAEWQDVRAAALLFPFVLPLLTAIAFPLRVIHDYRKQAIAPSPALVAFVVAGFLGAYPRFDLVHVSYAAPWLLLALAHAFRGLSRTKVGLPARSGALLALSLILGDQLIGGARRLTSAEYGFSRLPHLRGALLEWQHEAELARASHELAAAGTGAKLFLLSSNAGFYYLTSGLPNHTPFDYPFVTTFGRRGESRVLASLRDGRLTAVCLDPKIEPALAPPLLLDFVERRMSPDRDLGVCTLYHVRPAEPPRP